MRRWIFVVALSLVVTSVAFPGTVNVKNISLSMPATFYYFDGSFQLDTTGAESIVVADVQTYDAIGSEYDYRIEDARFVFSPCGLAADNSVSYGMLGGQAIGEFYGGGSLTLTGNLVKSTDTATVLYSGTILVADMQLTDAETWVLKEQNYLTSILSSAFLMDPVDGGLNSGIDVGEDTLVIAEMNVGFTFVSAGVKDFSTPLSAPAPHVQIAAAIPEPMTLSLLGIGFLMLRRKK